MEPLMLKILWAGILAFFAASARRILRGPSSPGWSWRLEWIVAVQRAVLGAMVDWPPARIRKVMVGRVGPLARGLDLAEEELGGIPCERSTLPGCSPESHLLYLHGGGFTLGSIASHREVVSALTTYGNLCAHSVAYRQPPEDRFPAAVEDAVAAYRGLLDSGVRPAQITVAGDSAGGNLCLALLLRAKTDGLPMPASAALICPAPDMALPGESWHSDPYLDYLTRPIAQSWLRHYVDPDQYKDPLASPIHGDLRDLPPILIHAGGTEGLRDEIETLAGVLREAGVALTYRVTAEMPHVWHLFVGLIPEAENSLREIAAYIRETTNRT
jgi:monoterpene epsilon-lactone hydrolase